jgi:probable addiction module antidote protein
MPRSRPYKIGLTERLRDPEHVAAYLNAAVRESQDVFMLALRDVAEVHKISKVALAAGVNRETLYRTLSARGNPTLTTLESILEAVGVELYYRARVKLKSKRTAPASGVGTMRTSGALSNVANYEILSVGFSHTAGQLAFQRYEFLGTPMLTGQVQNRSLTVGCGGTVNPEWKDVPIWINNNESPRFIPQSVNP